MMLGEESLSADYWKRCGDEALRHGIKGVIMMGAHWDVSLILSNLDFDSRKETQQVGVCEYGMLADPFCVYRREGQTALMFP
jgi:hypothetical protein